VFAVVLGFTKTVVYRQEIFYYCHITGMQILKNHVENIRYAALLRDTIRETVCM